MDEQLMDKTIRPSREKFWKELSIEEKIERMRQQIKMTQYQETDTRETVMRLSENFNGHTHADGKICVNLNVAYAHPMQEVSRGYRGGMLGKSENPDEVYF